MATIGSHDTTLARARQIVIVGEGFVFKVRLIARTPDVPVDWEEATQTAVALEELEGAAQKAVKTALGDKYRVAIESASGDEPTVLYRVTTYQRLHPTLLGTSPGRILENRLLAALGDVSTSTEKIASRHGGLELRAVATWSIGTGLTVESSGSGGGAAEIEQRIDELRGRQTRLKATILLGFSLGLIVAIGSAVVAYFLSPIGGGYGGLYAALLFLTGVLGLTRRNDMNSELRELRDQLDVSELLDDSSGERRAQQLFQVHSHQIKRYYDQALRQRGLIFLTGLLCIFAGFAVIALALRLLTEETSLSKQIVIASLGAIGGILGNFIAVVYLRMFSETIKSIGSFHDRLVFTHHLHFANFLAAKIESEELRDKTIAYMAQALALAQARGMGAELTEETGPKLP